MNDDNKEVTLDRAEKKSRRTTTIVGVIAAVLVIVIVASFVLMIQAGTTGVWRDVIVIIVALESLIVMALMIVLVFQVIAMVRMLRDEIKPLIESAQDTVESARGTTRFVSQKVISPAISVASAVASVKRMAEVLVKGKRK